MTTKTDTTFAANPNPVVNPNLISSPRGPARPPIQLNGPTSPTTPSTTKPWAPRTPPIQPVDTLIEMVPQGNVVVPLIEAIR